jgi:hypothetical protein
MATGELVTGSAIRAFIPAGWFDDRPIREQPFVEGRKRYRYRYLPFPEAAPRRPAGARRAC